jgi:hypothetical protein
MQVQRELVVVRRERNFLAESMKEVEVLFNQKVNK